MKIKNLVLFLFFVPFVGLAQGKRIDCTLEIRDSCLKEVIAKDSTVMDRNTFFKRFDSLIIAYKIKGIYFKNDSTKVSHFLFPKRIILIDISSNDLLINKLTGEMAHAEQFARRPLYYSKKAIGEVLGAFFRSVLKRKQYKEKAEELIKERKCSRFVAYLWEAYRNGKYQDLNSFECDLSSFECEAHSKIEPIIKKVLWGPAKEAEKEKEKVTTTENY